jgi:hypothetical protein
MSTGHDNHPAQISQPAAPGSDQPLTPIEKNNKVFAGVFLICQPILIVLFAIFVRPQSYAIVLDNGLFEAVGTALLVIVGN